MNITAKRWSVRPIYITIITTFLLSSCKTTAPEPEDIPETITKVTLNFTSGSGNIVTASATDPDKDGPKDIVVDHAIELKSNTTYTLSITLINELHKPEKNEYSITKEIEDESDEHQFFYAWTKGLFSSPEGEGNIDQKDGLVNYVDKDKNGLPLGLKTTWETGNATATASKNTIRILLKHQPGIKSKESSAGSGESDLDLTFNIHIK